MSCSNPTQLDNTSRDGFRAIEDQSSSHIIKVSNNQHNKNVLFIGDSHAVGLFGKELFNRLQNKYPSSELYFYAVCGSSPSWWLTGHETNCGYWQFDHTGYEIKTKHGATPKLQDLIQKIQPNLIIIEQGTNLIRYKPDDIKEEVMQLIDFIKKTTNAKIYWIGPPDARKHSKQAINSTFLAISQICSDHKAITTLIDSRKFTHYPSSAKDGIHYNGIEGEFEHNKWAAEVANIIHF
jgi:hypothetical protein